MPSNDVVVLLTLFDDESWSYWYSFHKIW